MRVRTGGRCATGLIFTIVNGDGFCDRYGVNGGWVFGAVQGAIKAKGFTHTKQELWAAGAVIVFVPATFIFHKGHITFAIQRARYSLAIMIAKVEFNLCQIQFILNDTGHCSTLLIHIDVAHIGNAAAIR